ncbi:MAG: hypothetical protein J0G30_04350 [Actinomycetales bacterium]|nr:hypothetical protein [Actinomycetales bacterium]
MGRFRYGPRGDGFALDDRTLAHLEIVTLAKLRRHEPFALSLPGEGAARTTVWINDSSELVFEFDGEPGAPNRAWLDELIDSANSPAGLRLSPEPRAD